MFRSVFLVWVLWLWFESVPDAGSSCCDGYKGPERVEECVDDAEHWAAGPAMLVMVLWVPVDLLFLVGLLMSWATTVSPVRHGTNPRIRALEIGRAVIRRSRDRCGTIETCRENSPPRRAQSAAGP